ncbi:tRNA (adenosine(37)-N6)-threonylcarbamoyltransferase complex dimerization subunit type 1 TsaB [Tahibacter soli]|uniref:tRNA threonylcarbamoyladenosine biosynthesis protein TsaB n=1 Tax=Tahibacter soli TaxID=2983605 RepID=A0A9X3YJ31_9GAMM|nr:tRNA (adenosine(37)-N6)-threonylcarbamoyltransferase complex dimerization subunit type 1 TsaB [Tahibacter soli]MDC8012035.1 tRNA (adenosine(37)-N6)-threonylcarbamoyltransferase complex dimerization subunit type 1 TsaB [Tahibacter soli]
MNLLAIETSTEACSVALMHRGRVIARSEIAPRRHAELVLPMADALLAEAGLTRRALDGIAVGRGPGAFTGVRLAVSLAQGMALGLDLPVVPVSSLAALAWDAPDNGAPVLALIDARMGEVYAGTFVRDAVRGLVPLAAESVGAADALALPDADAWNVIGSGWDAYRDAARARLGAPPRWSDGALYPQAAAVVQLAAAEFAAGHAVAPELALPVYLRDKVALTLTEQRAARASAQ